MTVNLIWAQNEMGVIGADGGIPWNVPEDLDWFRRWTLHNVVVMGRKTWDSLPTRPLPERVNVVVTRDAASNEVSPVNRPYVFGTLSEALAYYRTSDVYVIGGGDLLRQAMPVADRLIVTEVYNMQLGDTYAPVVTDTEWYVDRSTESMVSTTGTSYLHKTYSRRG